MGAAGVLGAAGLLAAVAELARRRPAGRTPPAAGPGEFPARLSPFIADEIAAALTVTGRAADGHLDLGLDLAVRLPATMQALTAGRIDRLRAKVIADLTRILTAAHARQAEQQILDRMGNSTTGQLRALLARVIITIDPEAARRRREEAQRDPRVRRWQEDAGTAALAGFGLPPADVLAADQQLTQRALDLRRRGGGVAGGATGPRLPRRPPGPRPPVSARQRPASLAQRPVQSTQWPGQSTDPAVRVRRSR